MLKASVMLKMNAAAKLMYPHLKKETIDWMSHRFRSKKTMEDSGITPPKLWTADMPKEVEEDLLQAYQKVTN
ncbi:hypothetical protein [Joostella sp. CR20]|uniref:hypothetical protein n=1 Tax=Joostella sp. CR20 TaxID=2804312 RepID=UPI00313D66CB